MHLSGWCQQAAGEGGVCAALEGEGPGLHQKFKSPCTGSPAQNKKTKDTTEQGMGPRHTGQGPSRRCIRQWNVYLLVQSSQHRVINVLISKTQRRGEEVAGKRGEP